MRWGGTLGLIFEVHLPREKWGLCLFLCSLAVFCIKRSAGDQMCQVWPAFVMGTVKEVF